MFTYASTAVLASRGCLLVDKEQKQARCVKNRHGHVIDISERRIDTPSDLPHVESLET